MANAKKCDRCGKYYDKNNAKSMNGIFVTSISIKTNPPLYKRVFDLCDECIVDLYKFLGLEGKDEQ